MVAPGLLRRPLAAAASRLARACASPQVSLATGPRQNNSIFYEIRTYDIKPSKMKEFVEMSNKYFHLRMAHSELVGFWSAELGAMNKVVHVWKYDNFAHRTAVRQALAKDKDWQGKFLSPVLPLIEKQHNEVAYLVPWCQLGKPPKEGGVYEWVTFQMKPGGPALWGEVFRAAISAHINTGYTKLIGVFHTEYGLLNTVRDSVRFLESQQNMLLIPLQCSPLK
ncbi:protein NipSnap homolog 3A isoform X2 [Colius striatus]|uniref:protein NipSnap homolog 3A isoform X2 n=1 Tax=Colius striatus TaxID=57412 RepID=UPI002B1E201E|nr:protein NipSnap homolog 3A isoform X2 [Colius striatus]